MLEKKPLKGFMYTLILGSALVFIGGVLSIILIGIPIFIAGICILMASPITAFMVKFGECPNCHAEISLIKDNAKCRKCKARLIVTNNQLQLAMAQ